MEPTINEVNDITRTITLIISPDRFNPFREERLKDLQKKVTLKGYRQGKVPLSIVKKLYGSKVEEEVMEMAIQKEYEEFAEANNVQPFGTPMVRDMKDLEDGSKECLIEYEVLPEFELGEYKGLTARKVFHAVTPEEIDKEIEWLRERHRTEETVDMIADENHTAVVDFQKLDDTGVAIIGDVSRDIPVNLTSERINPELRTALLGKRLDEKVRISLPTGEDEQEVPYELTIKDIKHVVLPEVDQEFARKVTGEEEGDIEDLRDMVKQSIEAEYENEFQRLYRDELIEKLIEAHEFNVPQALVSQVLNGFLEDEKKKFPDNELPENYPVNKFIQSRLASAIKISRWLLLRDRIAEAEEITVEEDDIEAIANAQVEQAGIDPETIRKYFTENEQAQQQIVAEKVIQFLVDYSEVSDEIEDVEWQKEREEEMKKLQEEQQKVSTAEGTDAEATDDADVETENESETETVEVTAVNDSVDDESEGSEDEEKAEG